MAIKTPDIESSECFWLIVSSSFIFSNEIGSLLPKNSIAFLFHKILIFEFLNNLSCKIFAALKESLLWIKVTLEAKLVKNNASSTAVFPPPITATS